MNTLRSLPCVKMLYHGGTRPDLQVLDPKTAAVILGIHHRTILRLFSAGEIPAKRVGTGKRRIWRTTREAIEEYMRPAMPRGRSRV